LAQRALALGRQLGKAIGLSPLAARHGIVQVVRQPAVPAGTCPPPLRIRGAQRSLVTAAVPISGARSQVVTRRCRGGSRRLGGNPVSIQALLPGFFNEHDPMAVVLDPGVQRAAHLSPAHLRSPSNRRHQPAHQHVPCLTLGEPVLVLALTQDVLDAPSCRRPIQSPPNPCRRGTWPDEWRLAEQRLTHGLPSPRCARSCAARWSCRPSCRGTALAHPH
jgi:hypothetical protein